MSRHKEYDPFRNRPNWDNACHVVSRTTTGSDGVPCAVNACYMVYKTSDPSKVSVYNRASQSTFTLEGTFADPCELRLSDRSGSKWIIFFMAKMAVITDLPKKSERKPRLKKAKYVATNI